MLTFETNQQDVPNMENVELHINSDDEIEEINEKMTCISEMIACEFTNLKKISSNLNNTLDDNYNSKITNKNFDEQELIEEKLDTLLFEFSKVKVLLKKGREIRYYKELKEKEIEKQKIFARNLLIQYGIKPFQ